MNAHDAKAACIETNGIATFYERASDQANERGKREIIINVAQHVANGIATFYSLLSLYFLVAPFTTSRSVQYGYYGAGVDEGDRGEALTVSDPNEVYLMHLLPDPTGLAAVWVARRVPDGHITAAANAFVIRGVDMENDLYVGRASVAVRTPAGPPWDPSTPRRAHHKMKLESDERRQ